MAYSKSMTVAKKMGFATPKTAPSTTQKDMDAAMTKAAKTNTLGVGFGGEPKVIKKRK